MINVKLAQRDIAPLARLRERAGEITSHLAIVFRLLSGMASSFFRERGMAIRCFIIHGGKLP
jgi:hypothetical protein